MTNFAKLSVGDRVAMPTQGNLAFDFSPKHRILWVDRLTATQAVLSDGQRIRLKDGAIVGRPGPAVHAQAVTPKFMKRHLHELEMSRRNSAAMAVLTGMIQSRATVLSLPVEHKEALAKVWLEVKAAFDSPQKGV